MSAPPKPAEPVVGTPGSPEVAGLTSQEAAARLTRFGPNDPAPPKPRSAILEFIRLFLNPLVLILLIAAAISVSLGEVTDAGIIIAIVVLSNTLDFYSDP